MPRIFQIGTRWSWCTLVVALSLPTSSTFAESQASAAPNPPVSFLNKVVPIFTKHGCNSGGCHGKSGGQNGFRLSLLGFEPQEDYEHLVKEARGRRLFPAVPERSLLLEKATNAVPHGGGMRFDRESFEYRLLRQWIDEGMVYTTPGEATLARISVAPERRTMRRQEQQQLTVTAHLSDGSAEDVSALAQYDANDREMADVSAAGLVTMQDLPGEVAIMVRYLGQVAVFNASQPLDKPLANLPPARNYVDEAVFAKLGRLGLPPAAVCDDSTFLRRVTIDIAGRLPTPAEARTFLADPSSTKRDQAIDRLLASGEYADYFANKWSAILRNRRRTPSFQRGAYTFHAWIRESLFDNKPYDEFVRDIVASSGDIVNHPSTAWYREVNTVEEQVENSAQLFLGVRIQCARCHHHPYERWSQRDYYSYSAFFARPRQKVGADLRERRVGFLPGIAAAFHPKTKERLLPTGLGAAPAEIPAHRDPREELVDWMAEPTNPYFAPALVNRYWKHFLGRGIVDPEDDLRVTNPPSNPELLAALSQHFVESRFDFKQLIRDICRSTTYQLNSEGSTDIGPDKQNYSHFYPRRLHAEVLLDAVDQVAGTRTDFGDVPLGTRAVQLPDSGIESYFLKVFGKPESATACECERSVAANLSQSLHLFNSAEVLAKFSDSQGRAVAWANDAAGTTSEHLREAYLLAFARYPSADELQVVASYVDNAVDKRQAYEDVLWALVNTKEFMFNH